MWIGFALLFLLLKLCLTAHHENQVKVNAFMSLDGVTDRNFQKGE